MYWNKKSSLNIDKPCFFFWPSLFISSCVCQSFFPWSLVDSSPWSCCALFFFQEICLSLTLSLLFSPSWLMLCAVMIAVVHGLLEAQGQLLVMKQNSVASSTDWITFPVKLAWTTSPVVPTFTVLPFLSLLACLWLMSSPTRSIYLLSSLGLLCAPCLTLLIFHCLLYSGESFQ